MHDKLFSNKKSIESIDELVDELIALNPGETFEKDGEYGITSSIRMDNPDLKLPEGFYYNDKNGLTNKHNTESGKYITCRVNVLNKESEMPKETETVETSSSTNKVDNLETTTVKNVPFYKKAMKFINL